MRNQNTGKPATVWIVQWSDYFCKLGWFWNEGEAFLRSLRRQFLLAANSALLAAMLAMPVGSTLFLCNLFCNRLWVSCPTSIMHIHPFTFLTLMHSNHYPNWLPSSKTLTVTASYNNEMVTSIQLVHLFQWVKFNNFLSTLPEIRFA